MEGGQKNNVDLEAGLDIKTSDMLVPINQATFQHNWQRWQGNCLPNSLRFEKNGWAAGWNVYDFKFKVYRERLDDGVYAELAQLNQYVSLIGVYDSETSLNSLAEYPIVSQSQVISGPGIVAGDQTITGVVNGKPYTITNNPITHIASVAGAGVSLVQTQNSDYSNTLKVIDDTSSFNLDFGVSLASALTGDSLTGVAYRGFDGTRHTWGSYEFNTTTNVIATPEAVNVTVVPVDNTLSFSYSKNITDESFEINYSMSPFYVRFTDIVCKDAAYRNKLLVGDSGPSETLAFNRYTASVSPNVLSIGNTGAVDIEWAVPVWASCGAKIAGPGALTVKYCDNTAHNEVAIFYGTGVNNEVTVTNAYTSQTTTIELDDNFRPVPYGPAYKNAYPQYVRGLAYRFNQIIASNTIEPSKDWKPLKVSINTTDTWVGASKRYANLAAKNIRLFKQLLGNVYTYGSITFNPSTLIEPNYIFNWEDEDSAVYNLQDISKIISIKRIATPDTLLEGNDTDYINTWFPITTLMSDYIARRTGSITGYVIDQAAKTYAELYASGTYIGGTYAATAINVTDTGFWPFESVPRFNLKTIKKDSNGNNVEVITNGVYWTDGTSHITNPTTFKAKVLGTYSSVAKVNEFITTVSSWDRTRIVKKYNPVYDFAYIKKSAYEKEEDYDAAVDKFDELWDRYYPNIDSPQGLFSESDTSNDTRYTDYIGIELVGDVTPDIAFVNPGMYISTTDTDYAYYSVPFSEKAKLVLYNTAGTYTLTPFVYHQNTNVSALYNLSASHVQGGAFTVSSSRLVLELPFYFGEPTTQQLDFGTGTDALFNMHSLDKVRLEPASLVLGVNYIYDGSADTWTPTSIQPNAWLGHVGMRTVAGSKGNTLDIQGATLNTGVTQMADYQFTLDINSGIKFAWPLKGYTAARLTYPKMVSNMYINNKSSFELTRIPTAELTGKNHIYIDRNDKSKSYNWAEVVYKSAMPAETEDTGNYRVTLKSLGDFELFFAKQKNDAEGNEVFAEYYIPAIAYGNKDSGQGNLTVCTDFPALSLEWVPNSITLPISGIMKFSSLNTFGTSHSFYKNPPMGSVLINTDLYDFTTQSLPITFTVNDNNFNARFNSVIGMTTPDSSNVQLANTPLYVLRALSCAGVGNKAVMTLSLDLLFNNNTCKFYESSTVGFNVVAASNTSVTLEHGSLNIVYMPSSQQLVSPKADLMSVVVLPGSTHRITAEGTVSVTNIAYFKSVYNGTYAGDIVTFEYNGHSYSFDISVARSAETGISVLSTDIREADKTKYIGLIKQEGQYQFLKQQWNTTVEVENYWWIDSMHILELNMHSFILKRNTSELDDWNGNRFEKVQEVTRNSLLPSNIMRYFVTNVYNSNITALLCTLKVVSGSVVVSLIDPREKFSEVGTIEIRLVHRSIGEVLNQANFAGNVAYFNTYNVGTVDQLLSKADWSNTIVDGRLIIGCHLSSNYDQWALAYDLATGMLTHVVQGYGYVGLHGDLTGGMIPSEYFDATRGFNGTVQSLEALGGLETKDLNSLDSAYEVGDVDRVSVITPKVVGTSEQQWYIQRTLFGIVSHLTFEGGNFVKQILPITNNYTSSYKSPSFNSFIVGDSFIQAVPMADIVQLDDAANAIWQIIWAAIGYPMLYYIAPRYSALNYLQQTFGQYAYVHYNSSKSPPEQDISNSDTDSGISSKANKQIDPVLSSSFTFDKQKFTQASSTELDFFSGGLMAVLVTCMAGSLQILDTKLAVNEEQAQTATSDIGRKYVDNAMANVGDMVASSIVSQSKSNIGIMSAVTGLKSLDMFYSTSDQQRIYAGPGFVEHQFVANCVAQSVTDVQLEGKVQTVFFCIRALTTLQIATTIKLALLAADALDKVAEATAQQMVKGTSLAALAIVIHGTAAVMRAVAAAQEIAAKELDTLLDAICNKGVTSNIEGAVSKHALSVEGKHKYGEKNEVFMWPCWGINPGGLSYTDEWVESGIRNTPWQLCLKSRVFYTDIGFNGVNAIMKVGQPRYSSNQASYAAMKGRTGHEGSIYNEGIYTPRYQNEDNEGGDCFRAYFHQGAVPYYQASAFGKSAERTLPNDMAKVEGVVRFLPNEPFKNENISVSEPAFAPSMQQDYVVDKAWDLSQYCTYGAQQWIAVKDTKIIDCPPSNMYVNSAFCGIASPYTAVEVKRGIQKAYLRPWAITPTTLAINCTGYNTVFDNKLYHAFDGMSYRLVDLVGSPGMAKNRQTFWYAFQVNDRFKRSNKVPANELQGNFESEPVQGVVSIDKLYTLMTVAAKEKGLEAGTIGEDKDLIRWALPLFTEHVSTLPAAVKTMTAMPLGVVEGVTSLCVDLANNQVAYKAPLSVDFTIGKNVYRATEEYICSVQTQNGIDIVTDLIPTLGLKYIGATPTEAFFYSKVTRCYYSFTGSALAKMDMMERFRDVQKGYWDFVNQEVVMPCLMTYKRLNAEVEDKDSETDNIIVPVMSKGHVTGEIPPPITTVFNDRSWYKCISLPSGFAYQGPNRVIINRSVFVEYMLDSMKDNFGRWKRMSREKYVTKRGYANAYEDVLTNVQGVDGWTHNPFLLVTSPLGNSEDTDCLYEWNITFSWPIEMDLLYGTDNYAVVNITAETMTPGGKVTSRPTHVFLTKELFTRNGNYGYYSFRFQSKNGAGNRERLHIWSDQYIAISSLAFEVKVVTSKRTEQLTQQIDVRNLKEL